MPIAWASHPTLLTRPPFPRGQISRDLPTKSSSSTTSWIVWLEAWKPIPYLLLGPSTLDLNAPNTFTPPRSISIWLANPLLSLKTHPIKWVSSVWSRSTLRPFVFFLISRIRWLWTTVSTMETTCPRNNYPKPLGMILKNPSLVLWFPIFSPPTLGKIYPMATSVMTKSRQNFFVWALDMNYGPTLATMPSRNWTTSLVSWRKSRLRNPSRSTLTRNRMLSPSLLPHQTAPSAQQP